MSACGPKVIALLQLEFSGGERTRWLVPVTARIRLPFLFFLSRHHPWSHFWRTLPYNFCFSEHWIQLLPVPLLAYLLVSFGSYSVAPLDGPEVTKCVLTPVTVNIFLWEESLLFNWESSENGIWSPRIHSSLFFKLGFLRFLSEDHNSRVLATD